MAVTSKPLVLRYGMRYAETDPDGALWVSVWIREAGKRSGLQVEILPQRKCGVIRRQEKTLNAGVEERPDRM